MERLTIKTPKGAALKMADAYDSQDSARQDLMERYRVAVDRLAAYEDTGLDPEEIFGLCSMGRRSKMAKMLRWEEAEKDGRLVVLPPNDPLTLEELREMDGEPVWCVDSCGNECWCLLNCNYVAPYCYDNGSGLWDGSFYGMPGDGKHGLHELGWLAYRRKPEKGEEHRSV